MGSQKILQSAAASASYNMILQLVLRLLTFVLNAFILRFISKEVLGIVNVRLMLLYTTVLFVSREAFRRACLSADSKKPWQQVINFLWCTVPIGAVSCVIFGGIWAYVLEQPDPSRVPYYSLSVLCFAVSCLIELLAEPLYISAQMLLFVRLKVLIEGLSLLVRCVLSVTLIVICPQLGLLVFSIAQLAQTVTYTVMYYGYFIHYTKQKKDDDFPFKSVRDFFPRIISGQPAFSLSLVHLTWSFFKQSFLKQLLTEGERYVMTIFDVLSFGDQGVYDVINNLGSLVARFLFLPLEDSGYLFFTQTLQRGIPAKQQNKESMVLASTVLYFLLKTVTLIGLTIVTFGYPYSYLVLDLYGGQVLSSGTGPLLLRCYCMYVLLLAVNGITECFTFATMGQSDIDLYNHKMLLFSAIFLGSAWYLTGPLGSVGFILANCLNMLARIAHSIRYMSKFYQGEVETPLEGLKPAPIIIGVFGISFVATFLSEKCLCCDYGWLYRFGHIGVGGVCLLVVLGAIYQSENQLISFIKSQYLNRKRLKSKSPTESKTESKNTTEIKKDL